MITKNYTKSFLIALTLLFGTIATMQAQTTLAKMTTDAASVNITVYFTGGTMEAEGVPLTSGSPASVMPGGGGVVTLSASGPVIMTELRCVNNSLTSLDVSGCTALTYLDCVNNSLTSLDVSGCTTLETLTCAYNSLPSLDVSECTALRQLYCSHNSLPSLDVSECTALTFLTCDNNSLMTDLDVSANAALEELYCPNNSLPSLDVSECTALKRLECYNNSLTSLDVSANTALEELDCHANSLTSLDVSGCPALQDLWCYNNSLTSLDISGCNFFNFNAGDQTIVVSQTGAAYLNPVSYINASGIPERITMGGVPIPFGDELPAGGGTFTTTAPTVSGQNIATPFSGTIVISAVPAAIITQPMSEEICSGSNARVEVVATGTFLQYQWLKDDVIISGATGSYYDIINVQPSDAGLYTVVVTASIGEPDTSNAAVITVTNSIVIESDLSDAMLNATPIILWIEATGENLTYQWYYSSGANATPIEGATSDSISVCKIGDYHVIVSNECGPVSSDTISVKLLHIWQERNADVAGGFPYYHPIYPDSAAHQAKYGLLYDFETAQNICPEGWGLPTQAHIDNLIDLFNATELKAEHEWLDDMGNNLSEFNALPAGFFNAATQRCENLMGDTYFWTSEGKVIHLACHCGDILVEDMHAANRVSVRCVKVCGN